MGKFWIENAIFDDGWLKKISGNDLKVLLAITRHYNKSGTCYPSIRRLESNIALHHVTISQSIKRLAVLKFLEQLEIKEGYKLRYSFSKTARFLLPGNEKPLVKPDTKEVFKEVYKENKNIVKENYRGREVAMERLKKSNPEEYKKLFGNLLSA